MSRSDEFPYTDRQRRWWFATHGEKAVTPNNEIDALYRFTRTPKTVSEAEAWAREHLGIEAEYGKDLEAAKAVNAALMDAKAAGAVMPRRVVIAKPKSKKVDVGEYMDSDDTLTISPNFADLARKSRPGWLSTSDDNHAIWHELGHVMHRKALGDRWDNIKNVPISDLILGEVRNTISRYGASNGREFVAEIYAGLLAGKKYSENVMRIYVNVFGGVVPQAAR